MSGWAWGLVRKLSWRVDRTNSDEIRDREQGNVRRDVEWATLRNGKNSMGPLRRRLCYPEAQIKNSHGANRCTVEGTVRLRRLLYMCALLCTLLPPCLTGQSFASEFNYVVRIETYRPGEDVCVLLRGDGQYHLEKLKGEDARIFEGSIPVSEVEAVEKLVNTDELRKLSQSNITTELIQTDHDELYLAVFRRGGIQNLRWPSSDTLKPYHHVVDPLLEWFHSVQNLEHKELSEDAGRTNCLPPGKIELKTRAPQTTTADEPGASSQVPVNEVDRAGVPYLVWMGVDGFDQGLATRTCIIVYPTGQFRWEKSTQKPNEKLKLRAFEGSVSDSEVQRLLSILNEPELKDMIHPLQLRRLYARQQLITQVAVPRANKVQKLGFAGYYGLYGTDLRERVDDAGHMIKPLQHWFKTNIQSRKWSPLHDPQLTNCVPAHSPQNLVSK